LTFSLFSAQTIGAKIKDSKRIVSEGEALGLTQVAQMDAEVVARYVETKISMNKNRGKAKSYNEKQLEVGEFNASWLDGIDERIRKIRLAEDLNNQSTCHILKSLRQKVKATGVRTTF